jgi:hypothetical protein
LTICERHPHKAGSRSNIARQTGVSHCGPTIERARGVTAPLRRSRQDGPLAAATERARADAPHSKSRPLHSLASGAGKKRTSRTCDAFGGLVCTY